MLSDKFCADNLKTIFNITVKQVGFYFQKLRYS